jgi:subtilisin family serine protease
LNFRKAIFGLLFIAVALESNSQVNRYMVFFTDKINTPYVIASPQEFLTPRSIERRTRQGIQVSSGDLPVDPAYVAGLSQLGAKVMYTTKWMNGSLVECSDSIAQIISSRNYVSRLELVAIGARPVMTNSFYMGNYHSESGSRKMELANAVQNNMLGADRMHELGYDGTGILIAILDAGFAGVNSFSYFSHLFAGDRIIGTRNFVAGTSDIYQADNHGTEVISCIAAFDENSYKGIAYNSSFILCITEDVPTEYKIEEYNWLFGAEYADSLGADIINSSVGYNTFDSAWMDYSYESMDGNTAVSTIAADIAASKGMLCVISVGNEGNDAWKKLVAPADADSVLSVGAVNSSMQPVTFSSRGPASDGRIKPEVAALGYMTAIIAPGGSIGYDNGTSFSTPLVSGLAAGVWQAYPDLSNMELIEVIEKGSSKYQDPDTLSGYGIPDFRKIRLLITALSEEIPENLFKVYPNPVQHRKLFIESNNGLVFGILSVELMNNSGKRQYAERFEIKNGEFKFELDLAGFSPGVYILCLYSSGGNGRVKILIP